MQNGALQEIALVAHYFAKARSLVSAGVRWDWVQGASVNLVCKLGGQ